MTAIFRTVSRGALLGLLGGLTACQSAPTETELLRLHLLADDLTALNGKIAAANGQTVKALRAAVEKNQNQRQDLAVLRMGTEVHDETGQLVAYLRGLRKQLSPAAGKSPTLPQLAEQRAVAEVLLRGGQADTLQRRLSRYAAAVQPYVGYGTIAPLGAAGPDPRVRAIKGAERAGQGFREFYFQNASVAWALAVLAQQEAAVLRVESSVLSELSMRVGGGCGFDKIGLVAAAESNTVGEGEIYRAEMFLTASASGIRPQMMLNGRPLKVGPDGKGRVTLTAPRLPPDQSRQTIYWDGAITVLNNGRDTTFRVRVPYTIVRRR